MAHHNSSGSVIDTATAQSAGKKHGKLPIRSHGSPRFPTKSHTTLMFSSQPPAPTPAKRKSSPSRQKQLETLLKHYNRLPANPYRLYCSHKKADRARKLFLLKRQQWRNASRQSSFKMEWIEKLRQLQADEASDDEDFTFISRSSSSLTSSDGGDESVVSEATTAITTPGDSDDEVKEAKANKTIKPSLLAVPVSASTTASGPALAKKSAIVEETKELKPVLVAVSEPVEEKKAKGKKVQEKKAEEKKAQVAKEIKKAKSVAPKPIDKPTTSSPIKSVAGENKSAKRKLDDSPVAAAESAKQQPATKKSKQENGGAGKAVGAAVNPKLAQSLKDQGPPPLMSSAIPSSSARTKPAGRTYQPIVQAMLDDPLGFDDQVHDDNRKQSRQLRDLRRELASFKRYYKHPIPEKAMSGALGPTPDERFETYKKTFTGREGSDARRGGRASLRQNQHGKSPQRGVVKGRQQQHYQKGGLKGKHQQKQNHSKYKGSRYYSPGPGDNDDINGNNAKVGVMSSAAPKMSDAIARVSGAMPVMSGAISAPKTKRE